MLKDGIQNISLFIFYVKYTFLCLYIFFKKNSMSKVLKNDVLRANNHFFNENVARCYSVHLLEISWNLNCCVLLVISYLHVCMFFLVACSPVGVTGNFCSTYICMGSDLIKQVLLSCHLGFQSTSSLGY